MTAARLTTTELDAYASRGWILLHDLLPVEVAELQPEVDRIASWGDGGPGLHHFEMTDGGRRLARSEDVTPHSELLRSLLCDGAVPDVAGQLLGEPALLYKEKVNYKLAGGAGFSPHQDKPAFPFVDSVLSVMIAVDDATVENGCLEVVDGWHHELLAQDERGCIADDVVEALEWHPVELAAGDTLYFHALVPHRSGPNRSSRDRRALYPTYNGASEGELRESYYREKQRALSHAGPSDRVQLSLIGDFEGRPA